jgi:hypothetical protein
MVLTFGMTIVGCKTDSGNNVSLDGTWKKDVGGAQLSFIVSGSDYISKIDDINISKGTLKGLITPKSSTLTLTDTHVWVDSSWFPIPVGLISPVTITYILSGNFLIASGSGFLDGVWTRS